MCSIVYQMFNNIIFNYHKYSAKELAKLSVDLHLMSLAKFLKTKFNDKRSLHQLKDLIIEEYSL